MLNTIPETMQAGTIPESEPLTGSPRAFWVGLALMAASSFALIALAIYQSVWTAPELKRSRDHVVSTFEIILAAQQLERAVREAEREQRNRIVSEVAPQPAELERSAQAISARLASFKQLAAGSSEQLRRLPNLERQIELQLAAMRRIGEVFRQKGPDAARAVLRSGLEADLMRSISGMIDAVVLAEQERLRERQDEAARDESRAAAIATAAAVLALLVMGLGAMLLLYTFNASREAAAARYESEEMFRLLVSGVTDYAIYMLDPKGMVTSWNRGAARIKGYAAEEIIGWHFSRFYTEEDRLRGLPDQALQTAEREGKYEAEGTRVRKDGTTFKAHVVIDPLRNRSGRLVGFAKITRDVSERVQHEAALEQTRAALAQAQKMEALGQLTGGIAHDFNNLLTVIKGSIEILDRRLKAGDTDVARFIDSARRGADRAAALTQRLLAFARRQPLELKPLNPNKLIAGMVELLHRSLGEGISIETVLAGGLWWTSTDSNQLEASLLNLAVNARDAMPAGGKLTIETANTYLDEAYADTHEDVVPGQYVMVAVSDTGTGIPKEIVANIFDPFFTTKDAGKGTGLGLSQVYGFVKQSRGHIMIYSELGEGTTVKVYLPRLEEVPAGDNSVPVPRPPSPAPNRETLLVVEDDEDVRAFTVATLSELGYRVLEASDAQAAQALLAGGAPVDLLFTDVGLPNGVNGRQLADAARRDHPQLKVLFTTGYARNAIVHHGRLDPGVELLGKPYTQAQLAQRVRKLLDG